MRSASIALVGAFALIRATAANAAPAGPNLGVHNPNQLVTDLLGQDRIFASRRRHTLFTSASVAFAAG